MTENSTPELLMKGLDNLGNTCYMNSSLQALYAINEFREYILRTRCEQPLHSSVKKLFQMMATDTKNTSLAPTPFWKTFTDYKTQFKGREQHDAEEFLRFIIDGIHEEVNRAKHKPRPKESDTDGDSEPMTADIAWKRYKALVDDSYLVYLFVGQLRSTITCTVCSHESHCWDTFWDLSVSIPESEDECNLVDCLKAYISEEVLDNDSMPTCDECKRKQKSIKKLNFESKRLPLILIIQLKRFGAEGNKINRNVVIDEVIHIEKQRYELFACVRHRGHTCYSGHYDTVCKYRDSWIHFDDEDVTKKTTVAWDDVSGAYILFYRKPKTLVLKKCPKN